MKRNLSIALGVVVLAGAGAVGWFFTQGNAEPTTGVTAPEIQTTTTEDGAPPVAGDEPTEGGATTFELTEASTATFFLDEELRSEPTTVVATTGIIVGQIQIDREDLANSQIGTVLVNARDLTSDASLRDRAIRGPILDTDTFEFIEFEPTSIDGLSGAATVGDELSFTVTGALTIRDITVDAMFEVTATLVDDTTIEGFASTSVSRADYGLVIPSVPTVANVSDVVSLELEFVAGA